jgi:hypothetical protein
MAAASAQQKETDERDVVMGGDRRFATGAIRCRFDNGPVTRQTADADVQKTAEGESEEQCEDNLDGQHRGGSPPDARLRSI